MSAQHEPTLKTENSLENNHSETNILNKLLSFSFVFAKFREM